MRVAAKKEKAALEGGRQKEKRPPLMVAAPRKGPA